MQTVPSMFAVSVRQQVGSPLIARQGLSVLGSKRPFRMVAFYSLCR